MMVGLFEPHAAAWSVDGIPRSASFTTLKPDWDRMGPFLEKAMERVPVTLEVGVRTFFCGPESFTPDLTPAVGEAPGIRDYFVAAGMNSVGVLSAGGLGRVLAHWIIDGLPDVDVTGVGRRPVPRRPARAGVPPRAHHRDPRHGVRRPHPGQAAAHDARPAAVARARPAGEQRRLLREVSGWEGADWFAGPGETAVAEPTWGRAPWFEQWEAEHRAVREGVGLMDMSFMAKFSVTGRDAGRGARPAVGRRGRRRARLDHLYPVAERRRPARGRPDRRQARGRPVLGRRLRHRARPCRRPAGSRGARARRTDRRRHRGLRPAQPAGPAVARRARRP